MSRYYLVKIADNLVPGHAVFSSACVRCGKVASMPSLAPIRTPRKDDAVHVCYCTAFEDLRKPFMIDTTTVSDHESENDTPNSEVHSRQSETSEKHETNMNNGAEYYRVWWAGAILSQPCANMKNANMCQHEERVYTKAKMFVRSETDRLDASTHRHTHTNRSPADHAWRTAFLLRHIFWQWHDAFSHLV